MSEPATALLTLYRGTARTLRFTMTTNGSVAGWTANFSLRRELTTPNPLTLDKLATVADAGSPTTPGVFTVALSKADTLALIAGPYEFSLERVDIGNEDLLTIGHATVLYDVRNV